MCFVISGVRHWHRNAYDKSASPRWRRRLYPWWWRGRTYYFNYLSLTWFRLVCSGGAFDSVRCGLPGAGIFAGMSGRVLVNRHPRRRAVIGWLLVACFVYKDNGKHKSNVLLRGRLKPVERAVTTTVSSGIEDRFMEWKSDRYLVVSETNVSAEPESKMGNCNEMWRSRRPNGPSEMYSGELVRIWRRRTCENQLSYEKDDEITF